MYWYTACKYFQSRDIFIKKFIEEWLSWESHSMAIYSKGGLHVLYYIFSSTNIISRYLLSYLSFSISAYLYYREWINLRVIVDMAKRHFILEERLKK